MSLDTSDMQDASRQRNGKRPDLAGTWFTDSNGNTFYYTNNGDPKYVGLSIQGIPPRPSSVPNAGPAKITGLAGPELDFRASKQGVNQSGIAASGSQGLGAASSAMDYPVSYNVGSSDYQRAAQKAFNDYLNASAMHDAFGMTKAIHEWRANPADYLKPDNGPQMGAYDPDAELLRARQFQDDMLGAVSPSAAWMSGVATMLGEDDETRHRWMEGGAEIGSELSPFVAESRELMGNPAARESLRPVGVPDSINDKGAAMEGAATLYAHRRGATKVFNGKYEDDKGFDGAYVLRDETGYPQVHVDSVKARNGPVPLRGRGSMTELGTNRPKTREKAEGELRKNIQDATIDGNFTKNDKEIVLDQLDKGDVVVNLVGLPTTRFHQGHIDFINNETPYKFGNIYTLDPFTPSGAPLLNGAPYGLSSVYLADPDSSVEKP